MPGKLEEAGPVYLCRFVSADSERVVEAEVVARDPRHALSRFVMMNGSGFDSGKIEVLNEQGRVLLTRVWNPDPT